VVWVVSRWVEDGDADETGWVDYYTISLIQIYLPHPSSPGKKAGHATYHSDARPPPETAYSAAPADSLLETSTQQETHHPQTASLPVLVSAPPSTTGHLRRQDRR
jgi:hypothetical protein